MLPLTDRPSWRLQDAKAQFSAVVDRALGGVPQHVTRRGKQAVVVLSALDFAALQSRHPVQTPSFLDHLRAMPKEPPPSAEKATNKRTKLSLRELEL